ncbi:GNAT family N-acetyltransferase [Microbacterium lushaniae]|nr:GNAT family N-acetyltransferase [Microbacterium lushaniae]KAA9158828.1 GNAT family N-acetyltransferase [Microbacterium lushaniae]
MTLTVVHLSSEDELARFSSGTASVDAWFAEKAWSSRHIVQTYVCYSETGALIGCFALRLVVVHVMAFPSSLRGGANSDGESIGLLLAQMGVQKERQGEGFGREIVRAAMVVATSIHASSPLQLFVVDAENESLIEYYKGLGLRHIEGSYRLLAPMSKIAKAIQASP